MVTRLEDEDEKVGNWDRGEAEVPFEPKGELDSLGKFYGR